MLQQGCVYNSYVFTKLINILFQKGLRERCENQIYSVLKLLKIKAKVKFGFILIYQLFEAIRPMFGLKKQSINNQQLKKNKKIRPTYIYYRISLEQSYQLIIK